MSKPACWERGFAALERLSPSPEAMTAEQRLACAELWFCLRRGEALEERVQAARKSAEYAEAHAQGVPK